MSNATDIHLRQGINVNGPTMPGMRTTCWLWKAGCTPGGRGKLSLDGKRIKAHRYAWKYWGYELPSPTLDMHHICGNKLCVRPDHIAVCNKVGHGQLEKFLRYWRKHHYPKEAIQ